MIILVNANEIDYFDYEHWYKILTFIKCNFKIREIANHSSLSENEVCFMSFTSWL